jgi:hypothetical protein
MAAIMLIELWERLRGYDKWVEAEAKVVSYETLRKELGDKIPKPRESQFSSDILVWMDQQGELQFGPFVNHEGSRLFQTFEGEIVPIRYDPSKPSRYYNREYFVGWVANIAKAFAAVTLGGGFIVWRIWMIMKHRGY